MAPHPSVSYTGSNAPVIQPYALPLAERAHQRLYSAGLCTCIGLPLTGLGYYLTNYTGAPLQVLLVFGAGAMVTIAGAGLGVSGLVLKIKSHRRSVRADEGYN